MSTYAPETDAAQLLALTAIPELSDSAREQLLRAAQDSFSRLPDFLGDDEIRWIAILLEGAASPAFNAPIRPGLLRLAADLEKGGKR